MSSLKVKRLKQETVGNKQEELESTWMRSPTPPSRRPALGRVGEGLPPSPGAPAPSHLYKEGQGSPPRHTSFLSSKLNPRSRPRFRAIRFRAF